MVMFQVTIKSKSWFPNSKRSKMKLFRCHLINIAPKSKTRWSLLMNKTAIFFSKLHLFTILTKWRRCNSTRIRMYKCMAFESVQIDCIGNKCLDRFHLVWHNASIRHFFFVFLIYFTNGFLKISDCRFFLLPLLFQSNYIA